MSKPSEWSSIFVAKPVPTDWRFNTGDGVLMIVFSNRDIQGKLAEHVQLSYVFGPLGYDIKIYKARRLDISYTPTDGFPE